MTRTQTKEQDMGDVSYVVEEARTVPDGPHTGVIVKRNIVRRGDDINETDGKPGFQYLDIHIAVDGTEGKDGSVVIKTGFAASRISPETDLGHLLRRFGAPVKVGADIRPLEVLAEKTRVAFETETERNKNGKFARVVNTTLRPVK